MATKKPTMKTVSMIDASDLKVVSIGKFVVNTSDNVQWNIPHLHFIVSQDMIGEEKVFISTCLELCIDAYGTDEEKTVESLFDSVLSYQFKNISSPDSFVKLIELVDHNLMDDLWRVYRKRDYEFARVGADINTNLIEKIRQDIVAKYRNSVKDVSIDIKKSA